MFRGDVKSITQLRNGFKLCLTEVRKKNGGVKEDTVQQIKETTSFSIGKFHFRYLRLPIWSK